MVSIMQNSKIKNENKIERCLYCYHRITDFKNVIIHAISIVLTNILKKRFFENENTEAI